jgi:homoserine kinase
LKTTVMNEVKAFAPATVANVSCGFDIFGFAVDQPGDEVVVQKTEGSSVIIESIEGDEGRLPKEVDRNTAGVAVLAYLRSIGSDAGLSIRLTKKLPLGSGMGSSAASSVAALVAVNHLFGEPLTRRQLLPFAMEAERVACGTGHADNVAPSLLGGFVIIREYIPLDVIQIPVPESLFCTLVHPQLELKTEDSRKVLKLTLTLKDSVKQGGNIAGLVAGMMLPDFDLIGRSLVDHVVEPVRSVLIPGFNEIRKAAKEAGALGCGISGSGPTMFALSRNRANAEQAGAAMQKVFQSMGIESEVYVSTVNREGARILS